MEVFDMAVTTVHAHVNRALEFFNKNDIYFAIGKSTPWSDPGNPKISDSNPPNPDTNATDLQEIIGFKKVETMYLVVPDDKNGTIAYRDTKWRIVPVDQALQKGARWVYLDTTIKYDELPLGYYRQVGVYVGLKVAQGVSTSKYNLLPSEVRDRGVLEVIDNRQPSNRQIDQKEKLSIVLEF